MLKLRSVKTSNDMEEYHKFYIKKELQKKKEKVRFDFSIAG